MYQGKLEYSKCTRIGIRITCISTIYNSELTSWTEDLEPVDVTPFGQSVGPTSSLQQGITVLDLFKMFFTTALVASIVEETNRYAYQVLGVDSVPPRWTDVTQIDIWAFLGFALLMGINRLPALHHYWSKDKQLHYAPIADRIPRDRFLAIWRFLHFTDNEAAASTGTHQSNGPSPSVPMDRLWKVRPVITSVLDACCNNYRPNREQAIDEAMVAFKGRSSMKQYLPMKPTKRGFKIWVRADSLNGYICQFECYTGKKGDTTEVGLGGSVVTRLTRDLVGQNYHIYMDSFFSSVSLYKNLLLDHIYCTGTVRSTRRHFPLDLKTVQKRGLAERGDRMTRQEGNISVTVWQDTRPVAFMTSGHDPQYSKPVNRKKVDGSVISVECPMCIVDYNKYMGGVDKGDQYRKYYHVRTKSRKSYKYIFWFLFEVAVFNSFVLSRFTDCTHNATYLKYRQELARQLIGNYNVRKRSTNAQKTIVHNHLILNTHHYPTKLPNKGYCKRYPCHGQTVWYCATCDKRLCHTGHDQNDCFLMHHVAFNLFGPAP